MPREEKTVEEVRMQSFQRIAVTVAFSFTCFSVPVLGADLVVGAVGAEKSVEKTSAGAPKLGPGQSVEDFLKGRTVPGGGGAVVLPGATVGTGEEASGAIPPENGAVSTGAETPLVRPTKPDWSGSLSSQVQALREQFKRERDDLLKAYKEMQKQAEEVGKEERDKVKEQFKLQRDEMMTRQKELREELKRRFQEFRAEHPEHMEIIDAAKERAKEAVRERRGHGGE
jgi:hypothetical protein